MHLYLIARLSRQIISEGSAASADDRTDDTRALVVNVQRALAADLNGTVAHESLGHAAALLVQSVEPMLDQNNPYAARVLAALRSNNPLADPIVAGAFADALLELQDLAEDLGVGAREALA